MQIRARQEAILAMVAVASQVPARSRTNSSSAGKPPSALDTKDQKSSNPGGSKVAAKASKKVLEAQAASKGAAAASPDIPPPATAAAAGGAGEGMDDKSRPPSFGKLPYLPHVAGKSDPTERAEMRGWELEGQFMSLREAAQVCPPSFSRRISDSLEAVAAAEAKPLESDAAVGPAGVDTVDVIPELNAVTAQADSATFIVPEEQQMGLVQSGAAAAAGLSPGSEQQGDGKLSLLVTTPGASSPQGPSSQNSTCTTTRSSDDDAGVASRQLHSSATSVPMSPAAAAPGAMAAAADEGSSEVWRLPLVRNAPDGAFAVPKPEYQVAAGALMKQLQQVGVSSQKLGRGVSSRMSWPRVQMQRPTM